MIQEIKCMLHGEPIIIVDVSKVCNRKNRGCCTKCLNNTSFNESLPINEFYQMAEEMIKNFKTDVIECQRPLINRLSKAMKAVDTIRDQILMEFEKIYNELHTLKQILEAEQSQDGDMIYNLTKLEDIAKILSEGINISPNYFEKEIKMMINIAQHWKTIVEVQQKGVKQINDIFYSKTLLTQMPLNNNCCVLQCNQLQNMIVGGRGNEIVIWEQKENQLKEITVLSGHNDTVSTLIIYPKGDMIISGGERNDRQLKVWKFDHVWACIQTIKDHKDRINDIQLSNDQEFFISASNDKLIKIWKMKQQNNQFYCLQSIDDHRNKVYWLSINSECKFMASSSGESYFYIHSSQNWKVHQKISTIGNIDRVFFANSNELLVQQTKPPKILIYCTQNKEYQLSQQIQLIQPDNDDILFPIFQVNNKIYLKNDGFLYMITRTKSGKFFIGEILKGYFRSGCIDTTNQQIILRNFGNKSIEIYQ